MRRDALIAVVVVGLATALPAASASAALFCVAKPPCTGGTQLATLKAAVDQANAIPGGDRIEIGPGTFPFSGQAVGSMAPSASRAPRSSGRSGSGSGTAASRACV